MDKATLDKVLDLERNKQENMALVKKRIQLEESLLDGCLEVLKAAGLTTQQLKWREESKAPF